MEAVKRSADEIEAVYNEAAENDGKFHGMSYERGVQATIEWITGRTDYAPMQEDDEDE